eukprot:15436563-Alexandrium_andersonii.AAC.1
MKASGGTVAHIVRSSHPQNTTGATPKQPCKIPRGAAPPPRLFVLLPRARFHQRLSKRRSEPVTNTRLSSSRNCNRSK